MKLKHICSLVIVLAFMAAFSHPVIQLTRHPVISEPGECHAAETAKHYALIIAGIAGDENQYRKLWGLTSELYIALREYCGYEDDEIYFLFEEKGRKESIVDSTSRKEDIVKVFDVLKQKLRKDDKLFIFIAGHADFLDEKNVRFQVKGPDIKDVEIAACVDALPTNNIIAVINVPFSGVFMKHFSKPGRITITAGGVYAGKSFDQSEPVFPYMFVKAFADEAADADGDGFLSILEIFRYAKKGVADFFKEKKLIRTEDALLDDNGDGFGSSEIEDPKEGESPTDGTSDGKKARKEGFQLVIEA